MLRELRIENFAIIDSLDLSFAAGLNVLTGETGAGKSIIIEALELLLGARATPDLIRTGSDQAVVEVVLDLPENKSLRSLLRDQGYIRSDEDELILRRVISRSGKGRVQVNGQLVTVSALQDICRGLIDIHGQHEHQSLLYPERQADLLDSYGKSLPLREQYAVLFQEQKALKEELESLRSLLQEKEQREEYLRYQVQEIESVGLQGGEDKALEQEREILTHSQKLCGHAEGAYDLLYETEDSALRHLLVAGDHLREIQKIDHRFAETVALWESAIAQFKEVADQLRDYKNGLEHDPERLQEIEERLYLIGKLRKKFGPGTEDILNHLTNLKQELSSLGGQEERTLAAETNYRQNEQKVSDMAARLSRKRAQTAKQFKAQIEKELKQLGLGQTEFLVRLDPIKEGLSLRGAERINFLITTQPNEEPRALNKVASGGELSRTMLAIKTILAGVDQIPVLIFDEVDAGIGGAVAEAVGRRLKAIARRSQVFCITHLPQIAMFADEHYQVGKISEKGRIVTRVRSMNRPERIQEIARMLGGKEVTPISLEHAEEMIYRSHA